MKIKNVEVIFPTKEDEIAVETATSIEWNVLYGCENGHVTHGLCIEDGVYLGHCAECGSPIEVIHENPDCPFNY